MTNELCYNKEKIMFWDEEISDIEKQRQTLDSEFRDLLESVMADYLGEIKKHLSSLSAELKGAIKHDAFGNEMTPEGKDEEVWEYFAEKNLWENIFQKSYRQKQARYLDKLEGFLSETVDNPERHIELFGRCLIWRYYAKFDPAKNRITFAYLKTDDPIDPLSRTAKTFYNRLSSAK